MLFVAGAYVPCTVTYGIGFEWFPLSEISHNFTVYESILTFSIKAHDEIHALQPDFGRGVCSASKPDTGCLFALTFVGLASFSYCSTSPRPLVSFERQGSHSDEMALRGSATWQQGISGTDS